MLHALARSGLVLTGLLLLGVGLGNVVAGESKLGQYTELATTTAPHVPRTPATLFPATSEIEERHELARAKLAFYQLLVTAGRLLAAFGVAFVAIGVLRTRARVPRVVPRSRVAN